MHNLFDLPDTQRVTNVASVKQLSPFRYPGGKTWFIPHLRRWLGSIPRPQVFVEPFAGGGIVSCTVLVDNHADRVVMAELDADVAAVWQVIFSDEMQALADRITGFDLTVPNAQAILASQPDTTLDRAFRTIIRNRVNRGGVLADGAGMLKGGENGKGILSRWYPETLARRMTTLHAHRERMTVITGDGLAVLAQHAGNPHAAAFIDPPYTAGGKKAGSRLYNHSVIDHELLFRQAAAFTGPLVMTYDNATEVIALAEQHHLNTRPVAMKNTHHDVMDELLIGRDLNW